MLLFVTMLPLDFPHSDHALGRALPQREERGRALQPQRRRQRPPVVLNQRIRSVIIQIDSSLQITVDQCC